MSELALRSIAENKMTRDPYLDLGWCKLTKTPQEVSDLYWVERVNLGANHELTDITSVCQMRNLRILDLSFTNVCDITQISRLLNLERLVCINSKVDDLSPLSGLPNLQQLYCTEANVSDLSPLLPFIKKGIKITVKGWIVENEFDFEGCPLVHPPLEIVKQGNAAILNYFAEREKAQFKNTEIKLILVGNSTAGKTSLSRFLRERIYQSGEPTTHGICNERWEIEGRNLQVNLWDFGGQEYYHATHRLFLNQNAVYALVWDAQTDKGGFCETPVHFDNDREPSTIQIEHFPLKWWVKNIRHYTRESTRPVPIFLVQNKCARDDIQRVSGEFEKPPLNLHPEWIDNHIDIEATASYTSNPQPETRKWQRYLRILKNGC